MAGKPMNPIRKCCGYYCALTMLIGIFFYAIIIILELTNNQFVFNKMQPLSDEKMTGKTYKDIKELQEDQVPDKVLSIGIAIAVSQHCSLISFIAQRSWYGRLLVLRPRR